MSFDIVSSGAGVLRQGRGIEAMFFLVMLDRHFTVVEREVQGVGVGIEDDLIEVPDDDGKVARIAS